MLWEAAHFSAASARDLPIISPFRRTMEIRSREERQIQAHRTVRAKRQPSTSERFSRSNPVSAAGKAGFRGRKMPESVNKHAFAQ
jgi:hypothetical protein